MEYAELVETLRTACGFGRDLLSLNTGGDSTAKIARMNDAILTAQSYAIAAQGREMDQARRICTLEEEVERLTSWNAQKEDYELKSLGNTAFVYLVKKSANISELAVWLCQPCFEQAKKSIMQMRTPVELGWGVWGCPVCKTEIRVSPGTYPS